MPETYHPEDSECRHQQQKEFKIVKKLFPNAMKNSAISKMMNQRMRRQKIKQPSLAQKIKMVQR